MAWGKGVPFAVIVKILEEVRTGYQFSLVGYVLMPERVHRLIGEPVQVTCLVKIDSV